MKHDDDNTTKEKSGSRITAPKIYYDIIKLPNFECLVFMKNVS